MTDPHERYRRAADGFGRVLARMRPEQLRAPTPCADWDVRQLVNHMTRGNLNYALLARGGAASEFLALRDRDALGGDPLDAYGKSVRECAAGFSDLDRVLDYPLGKVTARQALAVRTADSVIHTWDLAQALDVSAVLDPGLVSWILAEQESIYAGLEVSSFFDPPPPGESGTDQDRLLRRFGRSP